MIKFKDFSLFELIYFGQVLCYWSTIKEFELIEFIATFKINVELMMINLILQLINIDIKLSG